jgi:excisionase family DNA binding protein
MTLLKVKEAAQAMNVSPDTVYDLVNSGALPSIRIGTGRGTIRIKPTELEKFLNRGQTAPAAGYFE